jgi:acyl-coenzyme A thioesterase PaaI-like protein
MATLFQRAAKHLGFRSTLLLARLWPPFLGAGIRVTEASADGTRVTVSMPLTPLNRNYVGVHFGGSLYAMCDPFFMIMLMERIGPGYVVWDKAGKIEFLSPGRGTVHATFELPGARVDEIRREADRAGKVLPEFEVMVEAADGEAVARVHKTLYVRPQRPAGAERRP